MNIVSKAGDYYHTLRYVTPVQIFTRVKYGLMRVSSLKKIKSGDLSVHALSILPLSSVRKVAERADSGLKISLLNRSVTYPHQVNWADERYGKLWNYHLQYADFLKQENLSVEYRKELILDLYHWLHRGKIRPEPYPASLRIMNMVRFLSANFKLLHKEITLIEYLYSELYFLENRLEYHLMGNHLMENAFALLMGGMFFKNSEWIETAEKIFEEQIPEQTLEDGAHFERSPMYHLILLFRYLEAICYLPRDSKLTSVFRETSKKMLAWIEQMSFSNKDIAHFNDSTNQQACTKKEIFQLAEKCGITDVPEIELSESGYKKFVNKNFELIIDAEGIAPTCQPGHAHADSLSFILHLQNQPLLTDPGVSTYEPGERRSWERSTKAHNTVTFQGQNTAGIWGRFRVGRRPEVTVRNSEASGIAIHLKHKLKSGEIFEHQRNFVVYDEFIEINDDVNLDSPVEGRLYFHPGTEIKTLTNQEIEFANGVVILFRDVQHIHPFTYEYCKAFNLRKKSTGIEYSFTNHTLLKILAPQA